MALLIINAEGAHEKGSRGKPLFWREDNVMSQEIGYANEIETNLLDSPHCSRVLELFLSFFNLTSAAFGYISWERRRGSNHTGLKLL